MLLINMVSPTETPVHKGKWVLQDPLVFHKAVCKVTPGQAAPRASSSSHTCFGFKDFGVEIEKVRGITPHHPAFSSPH